MSNPLRIVWDNSCERGTLSVTGAPQIPVGNLHTNDKNEVYRSAAGVLSVTFTQTYFTAETISCVAFSPCNFSTTATMRVMLYSDAGCTNLLQDSTTKFCSEGGGDKVAGLTAVQSASAYSYNGGTNATIWLSRQTGVLGVKIIVTDTNNLQGYLEAARLIIADYFSPTYNCEYGASVTEDDTTDQYLTDAGNLKADVGNRTKKLSFNMSFMMPVDRTGVVKVVKYCGKSIPVFISVFPENADKALEQSHTIHGLFTSMSQIAAKDYQIYSYPMEVQGL